MYKREPFRIRIRIHFHIPIPIRLSSSISFRTGSCRGGWPCIVHKDFIGLSSSAHEISPKIKIHNRLSEKKSFSPYARLSGV